jgi:hypothetical protein
MVSESAVRRWFSLVVIFGLVVLAGWSAQRIIEHAAHPSGYAAYRHPPEHYVYPTSTVASWLGAVAFELVVACWFIWRARTLTVVTGALAIAFTIYAFPSLVIMVDAPWYVGDHALFVVLVAVWLIAATVVLWIARIARHLASARG